MRKHLKKEEFVEVKKANNVGEFLAKSVESQSLHKSNNNQKYNHDNFMVFVVVVLFNGFEQLNHKEILLHNHKEEEERIYMILMKSHPVVTAITLSGVTAMASSVFYKYNKD